MESSQAVKSPDRIPGIMMVWVLIAAAIFAILVIGWIILPKSANSSDVKESSGLLGTEGVAQETFTESGMIIVKGELWQAEAVQGIILKGESVRVVSVSGLKVVVEKISNKPKNDS